MLLLANHLAAAERIRLGCPSSKGLLDGPVQCEYTHGGFHILCSNDLYTNAESVCAEFGWRLANLDDRNAILAQATLNECVGPRGIAWIRSFNSLTGEPCMAASGLGGAFVSSCGRRPTDTEPARLPVLCQEQIVETETQVSTSTWSVTQGVTSTTETVTAYTTKHRPIDWSDHGDNRDFDFKAIIDLDCPKHECGEVCPFQLAGLRIIETDIAVPYSKANAVCGKRGWRLAGVTSGTLAQVRELVDLCLPQGLDQEDVIFGLWARSYNGIGSAACNVFFDNQFMFALSQQYCNLFNPNDEDPVEDLRYGSESFVGSRRTWILCETDPGLRGNYSDGGWHPEHPTTTVSTNTTVMFVTPSSTSTVTETVTKWCKKGKPCGPCKHD